MMLKWIGLADIRARSEGEVCPVVGYHVAETNSRNWLSCAAMPRLIYVAIRRRPLSRRLAWRTRIRCVLPTKAFPHPSVYCATPFARYWKETGLPCRSLPLSAFEAGLPRRSLPHFGERRVVGPGRRTLNNSSGFEHRGNSVRWKPYAARMRTKSIESQEAN